MRPSALYGDSLQLNNTGKGVEKIARDYIDDVIERYPSMKKDENAMKKVFVDSLSTTASDKVRSLAKQVSQHEAQIKNKASQMQAAKEGHNIQAYSILNMIGKTFLVFLSRFP